MRVPVSIMMSAIFLMNYSISCAKGPYIGVNHVHLGWLNQETQISEIDNMRFSNVKSIRIDLVPPLSDSLNVLGRISQGTQSIILVISLSWPQVGGPRLAVRKGRGKIQSAARLSTVDLDYFRKKIDIIWKFLEERHIHLVAIELGNEINWADFNGDLEVFEPDEKANQYLWSITSLSRPEIYIFGLKRYVEALGIVKEVRDKSITNHDTKIISAGLAFMKADFAVRLGGEFVDPIETIDLLKKFNIDDFVDGYGIHMYPEIKKTAEENAAILDSLISRCAPAPVGKPCWLTEWGVADSNVDCPGDESQRLPVIRHMQQLIKDRARKGLILGSYYYNWSGKNEPYAIWRCGMLTKSGNIVLQPQSTDFPP